jgi:serpin B
MRKWNAFSLVLGTALLAVLYSAPRSVLADSSYTSLVAGNTDFALGLYGQLAAVPTTNLFFSPYSISTCLGMVYAGAAGNTASQMAEALDFSTNQAGVGPEFGALQAELIAQQGSNGIILNVANGLWAQTNFPFLPAFLANATGNYDAMVQSVDFTTDAPEICDQINDWVSEETDGMIANLLSPRALNPDVRLLLVDAIYFNGGWRSIFNTNLTVNAPFYVAPGQFLYVPMMAQVEGVRYYADSFLQAVELPYTNSSVTLLVLLPKTNGPASLPPAELSAVIDGLAPSWVDVRLPKFKLDTTINLVPILKNMGMVDAFMPGVADFSGIDGGRDLSIGSAFHEAVVEVNETGTIAAAATAIGIVSTVVSLNPVFQADHPFIFLIRDTNSGSILFMGRVDDPTGGGAALAATPTPMIQTSDSSFGIRNQQFGFKVAGTNCLLVVEACTNLAGGAWMPIQGLMLTNGSAYFSEPLQSNRSTRFYRVRPQ